MKKVALSLMALAVVAAGAFADAPKWDPKVSTGLKGEATATLGYDVDTGIAAFANGTSVSLIIDLVTGGEAITNSDKDVWGEIRVFTDGDPVRVKLDGGKSEATTAYDNGFKVKVDYAKIHFGKAAYLSVTSHDSKLGYVNSPDLAFVGHWFNHAYSASSSTTVSTLYVATGSETAAANITYQTVSGTSATLPLTSGTTYIKTVVTSVAASGTRYGKDEGALAGGAAADDKGFAFNNAAASVGAANAGGIEFGYSLDKIASLTLDVGSTDAWSTALVDAGAKTNIAYAAKVGLLAVDNLTFEVGYSAQTKADTGKVIGAKAAYTYKIDGDKLYVKPQVGFANVTPDGASSPKAYNAATASVLLGTGAKAAQFDNYGLKLDNDYGAYPGVSAGVFYNDYNSVYDVGTKKARLGLNVSANSGALIKDTTVVAAYDVEDLNAKDVKSAITLGASSSFKTGDITIAPKGFVVSESKKGQFSTRDTDTTLKSTDSALFAKATADITGVIPFVTFTINYESNDLANGFVYTSGGKYVADKMGKLEFTTKVSF